MRALSLLIKGFLLCIAMLCGCIGMPHPVADPPAGTEGATPAAAILESLPDPAPATEEGATAAETAEPPPAAPPPPCIPDWSCSEWSSCSVHGVRERSCTDRNACESSTGKPALAEACPFTPTLPPRGPYALSITGDPVCRLAAENAVNNLKYRASPDYEFFRDYVGAINCSYSDFCYMSTLNKGQDPYYTVCIAPLLDPPTIFIDQPFWNADPVWLAGVFVHEACHSEGYQEYILKDGADYDLTEFSGWKFERRCCDRMRTTWNQLGAPAFNYDLYRYCGL